MYTILHIELWLHYNTLHAALNYTTSFHWKSLHAALNSELSWNDTQGLVPNNNMTIIIFNMKIVWWTSFILERINVHYNMPLWKWSIFLKNFNFGMGVCEWFVAKLPFFPVKVFSTDLWSWSITLQNKLGGNPKICPKFKMAATIQNGCYTVSRKIKLTGKNGIFFSDFT